MARLGRRQVGVWTSRVSPIVLAVQFTADLTGASTGAATITAARSDAGGSAGATTAAATITAARADTAGVSGTATGSLATVAATASSSGVSGSATAAGEVAGVANIPSVRIHRGPFGRT